MNQLEQLIAEFRELDRVTSRPLSHEDYAIAAISFFQLKEVELVEENERLREEMRQDTVRHVREATEWKEATESVSQQNEILDLANQQLERVINELQSENAKQSTELEQLRSEGDKMRGTIKRLTELLSKCRGLLERYHDNGLQDHRQTEMLIEIQSALSGGSKQ